MRGVVLSWGFARRFFVVSRLGAVQVRMKGSNVRKSEDVVSSPYPTPSKENTER
jgi:hypothetical protein